MNVIIKYYPQSWKKFHTNLQNDVMTLCRPHNAMNKYALRMSRTKFCLVMIRITRCAFIISEFKFQKNHMYTSTRQTNKKTFKSDIIRDWKGALAFYVIISRIHLAWVSPNDGRIESTREHSSKQKHRDNWKAFTTPLIWRKTVSLAHKEISERSKYLGLLESFANNRGNVSSRFVAERTDRLRIYYSLF